MQLNLEGKVAIVTGGSKGIGRATALSLIAEGASVLVCARGQEALDETVKLAGEQGAGKILAMQADLTQGEVIKAVVARCIQEFGRVDILVNNAGSARPGDFLELSDEAWLDDWTLKFFGYMRMARAVLPHMQQQQGGVIVNVIGTGALKPMGSYMIGGAANAALNHFTKALADEGSKKKVRGELDRRRGLRAISGPTRRVPGGELFLGPVDALENERRAGAYDVGGPATPRLEAQAQRILRAPLLRVNRA
jgi:NAD(P)-dependent dehydrogenase (short-subunit alcohol dehydrogenase family)